MSAASSSERARWAPLPSLLVALLAGLALQGCWGGARRPLFGGEKPPPEPTDTEKAVLEAQKRAQEDQAHRDTEEAQRRQEGGPAAAAAPRPRPEPGAAQQDADALVRELDRARGSERRQVVDRLVAKGEGARAALERAADDSSLRADVAREVLSRLDTKKREAEGKGPAAHGLPPRRRSVDAPWVEEKYSLALDRFLAGDYLGAERAADAVLALEPDAAARPRLERLRRRCREQIVAESVALARAVPSASVLGPKDALGLAIRVENVGREPLELRHAAARGAYFGEVDVEYEELSFQGTRAKRRIARGVRFDRDAKLAPGESLVIAVDLGPSSHDEKPEGLVARYRIYGQLRPHTLVAGHEPLPYFLRVLPVEVLVVDEADRELAVDPRAKLDAAIASALAARRDTRTEELRAGARRAFVAACALSREDPAAVVERCATALEKADGTLAEALGAALSRATGEPGSFTREEWLAWWRGRASRPGKAIRGPGGRGPELDDAEPGPTGPSSGDQRER